MNTTSRPAPILSGFLAAYRTVGVLLLFISAWVGLQAQLAYPAPYAFTTLAGTAGNVGETDDTGPDASFDTPTSVTVDSAGNVYVADFANHTIRKITPAGLVSRLAGTPDNSGSTDDTGEDASFNSPSGVAVDTAGNVYVADYVNSTIRKITPAGVVTTLAGTAGNSGFNDDTGAAAQFSNATGVAVDAAGNVYVADYGNHRIRKISPGGVVTTLAGSGVQGSSDDPVGTDATFDNPIGVAVDASGNVYVAEYGTSIIRKITAAGVVTTLAGSAGNTGAIDDTGGAARFNRPLGVAVDSFGNVYVADRDNHAVRRITPAGVVTTLAGDSATSGSDDNTGVLATFNGPRGVTVDSSGNVYVADTANNIIRRSSPSAAPTIDSAASVAFSSGYTATATGGDSTGALVWSLGAGSTASGAAINSSTGVVTFTSVGTVVFKANRVADGIYPASVSTGDFTLTVNKGSQAAVSITSSASGTYAVGYTATATGGTGSGALVWTLGSGSTASDAAINASTGEVIFTSPGTVVFNVYREGDTNYNDSATTSDFTLTVAKAPQATLTVTSSASGTFGGGYNATVSGGSGNGAILWSLGTGSTAPGAAIDLSGAVTSSGAGTVVIKATKAADSNYLAATSADFTITLAKANQATLSVSSSASGTFGTAYTATATGGSGAGVLNWSLGTGSTAPDADIDSAGEVTSSGPGTVVIRATKAADSDYNATISADFTITLAKAAQATLSVTSAASGTFGAGYNATAAGGSGTGALLWSLGTGSTAPGAAIDSSGAVTSSGAGTVVIKVTKASDSNYLAATSADFTVTLAPAAQNAVSITSSASGTYGVAYTATATGGSGTGALVWTLGSGSTASGAAIHSSTGVVTFTSPGTVVFNVYRAGDANYDQSATTSDFTLTVAKAPQATVSVNSSASGTFGSAYTATATGGSGAGALSWSLGTGSTAPGAGIDISTGAVQSSGAGTVVIKVTKATDTNYLAATSADFTITLAKAAQAAVSITSSASGTYGVGYTATATGGSGTGALVWTLGSGSTASGAAINSSSGLVTFTSPGTVVFNVYRAGDANYTDSATTSDFTLTVAKAAQATLSVSSSASGTFGTAYTATATGGSGTGGLTWSLGTGSTAPGAAINASTGAVASTGAGTVVIKVTKATDTNYLVATSADFTITLAKATQATLSVSSSASGTFGSAYTATATGGNGVGSLTWSLGTGSTAAGAAIDPSTGAVTSTGAGNVVIKVTKASDANYLAATSADFTVTLAKAAQATLSVNSSASGTFGVAYTATATGGTGTGALSWSLGTGSTAAGAAINATTGAVTSTGAGTVVINVTKATDTNYLAATSADFTITVAKAAQATLSVNSSASGTFGTAYTATATGGSGTGALSWSLGTGSTAPGAAINSSTGAVTSTGAGTVVIKATKATDTGYLAATSADFTVTLASAAQAAVSITSSAAGTYGVAYTATATGGSGTGALVWTLGSGSTASGAAINASSGVVTFTSPGTVVFNVYRAGDANYSNSATTSDFTLTVAKAAQATLSVNSSASGTFGVAYTATATGGTGTGALSWSLGTGSTAAGAAINATTGAVTSTGAGTVVIKVTKATDTNYLAATSADFTITLAKTAQATLSVNSSASGTFGTAYTATATGGTGTGALSWSLGTGSTAPGAAINSSSGAVTSTGAGTVVINVTKATDTNYLAATSADFTITLGKAAQASLSVNSSASGTFGTAYTATATGGSGTGVLTWSLGTGSTAPGAAIYSSSGGVTSTGAGTVVVNVTKAADANYLAATSADFTITFSGAVGNLTFTTQPVGQTVNAGGSVTFTAAASGSPAPTYQWRKDGVAISGATNSSLTLTGVTGADTADYTVVATNSSGSVISSIAHLLVIVPPDNAVITFTVE